MTLLVIDASKVKFRCHRLSTDQWLDPPGFHSVTILLETEEVDKLQSIEFYVVNLVLWQISSPNTEQEIFIGV